MSLFDLAKRFIGNDGPNLKFTINGLVQPADNSLIWSIYDGTKKEDNKKVTVFSFDCVKQRDKLPLAKNSFKRFRTIKHPLVPNFIDGAETETTIVFATEYLIPLSKILEDKKCENEDFKCLGLFKIASVIKFLNVDCNLIHGNLKIDSIFTTKAGEWKLGGFELLSSPKEDSPAIFNGSLLPNAMKYAPPEIQRSSWTSIKNNPIGSFDSWSYGLLIQEIFNGRIQRIEELGVRGNIPLNLYPLFKTFTNVNPNTRDQISFMLENANQPKSYFNNEFIKASLFLEQWSIKESGEKDQFIRKLGTSLDSFPVEYSKYKVLPELINALEFGGAGAKALVPILKIGSKLEHDEFETLIAPIIIKLFAMPDRAVRMALCDSLSQFIEHLSPKTVSDSIFPNLASGFGDTSAPIRECTVKAILVIIPKLNERLVNNDLLRYLAKLQVDDEPGIRTNTTICIGKISKYLSESTKKKVLLPAFSRSIMDPFPPARNAALLAFAATSDTYNPVDVCKNVIPLLSPLLVDPESSIRVQALKNIEMFLKIAERHMNSMPETLANSNNGNPSSPVSNNTSVDKGWTGWAISAVSSKISGSIGNISKVDTDTVGGKTSIPTNSEKPPSPIKTSNNLPVPITSSALQMKTNNTGWDADGADGWGESWDEEKSSIQSTSPAKSFDAINSFNSLNQSNNKPINSQNFSNAKVEQNNTSFGYHQSLNNHWDSKSDDGWNSNPSIVNASYNSTTHSNSGWNDNVWEETEQDGDWGNENSSSYSVPVAKSSSMNDKEKEKEDRRKRMELLKQNRKNAKLGAKKI
ncbi:hypothetical protein HDU92_003521 [Lobulomyces angularis]|nr:hypothetical protein HDU92_003521 [Lobulomyces angularis]